MVFINNIVLGGPIYIIGFAVYRKKIGRLRKDIKQNIKIGAEYLITQKLFFEHTGQFFLGLDSINYRHHPVTAHDFANVEIGGVYVIYKAPNSGYAFNFEDGYSIF